MGGGRSTRALATGLVCFLCIELFLPASTNSGGTLPSAPVAVVAPSRDMLTMNRSLDPLNACKRRVPKGPDPIHNRYIYIYLTVCFRLSFLKSIELYRLAPFLSFPMYHQGRCLLISSCLFVLLSF
ncbi:hypothetical protein GW17_00034433 [Ensete ventricosum]|nr:hypothetical protein GW17_00034433 [Ensete ventricosum]